MQRAAPASWSAVTRGRASRGRDLTNAHLARYPTVVAIPAAVRVAVQYATSTEASSAMPMSMLYGQVIPPRSLSTRWSVDSFWML